MSDFIQAEARQQYESKRREQLASKDEEQTRPDDMPLADITCVRCDRINPAVHHFCRACGTSLWKTCAGCGKERPTDEDFCAECGTNMAEHERRLVFEYQERMAEIERLIDAHRLWDAARALRTIVSAKLHPRLEQIRDSDHAAGTCDHPTGRIAAALRNPSGTRTQVARRTTVRRGSP